jgi:hypothetical protein
MKDKLEKFVKEHRDEFDSFEPRPDLWQDISKELHQKKTPRRLLWPDGALLWKYAAAIALLISVSFIIWKQLPTDNLTTSSPVAEREQVQGLKEVPSQIAEVESYYTSLIQEKQAEIGTYDLKSLGIEENLKQDIAGLDSSYNRLKRELLDTPNKEQIMDAMILNLQMRMEILNRQLKTLEKIKSINKQKKNEHAQA